jgi:hypothetical protein
MCHAQDISLRRSVTSQLLAVVCLFGVCVPPIAQAWLPQPARPWLVVAWGMYLGGWLAIFAHEAAHFCVGRLAGLGATDVYFGPITARRRTDGWTVTWSLNPRIGAVQFAAFDPRRNSRGFKASLMAGPLVNLVGACALLLGANVARSTPLIAVCFLAAGLVWLLCGVGSLIPAHFGGRPTDGAQLLSARQLRPPSASELVDAVGALRKATLDGVRPRDLDPRLIEQLPAGPCSSTIEAQAAFIAFFHACDVGRLDVATAKMAHMTNGHRYLSRDVQRHALLVEAGYFAAAHCGNPADANLLLSSKLHLTPTEQHRLSAAAAYALGDYAQATASGASALAELESRSDGFAIAQADWLRQLIASANAHQSPTTSVAS